ncbi:ATP-binding cassette domain-containing protein [Klebsiella pneumoniae]
MGIVGESGCGKSTTAKALMNMVPFSGSAQLNGQELHGLKDESVKSGTPRFADGVSGSTGRRSIRAKLFSTWLGSRC